MSDETAESDTDHSENESGSGDDSVTAKPRRRMGKAIAWLLALLVFAALVVYGYNEFQAWRGASNDSNVAANPLISTNSDQIAALQSDVERATAALATVQQELEKQAENTSAAEIDALRSEVEQQLRLLNSLPSRLTALEGSMASLAGISAGARQTFLLAEAEYYLQIANAQLQLANNPELATLALEMADERVTQMSDPALINIRRSIADELAALEVMEKPDLAGATLTLASLARVAESLPLAIDRASETSASATDTDESGAAKAWGSVKDAMSGLVKVTPPEQASLRLLSPDAEYFLRNNIAMQLQAARLALLRGEQTVFEQALDDTAGLLDSYFDTQSEQVVSAQQTLAEIRSGVFTSSVPDISNSLRLLRQYRTLSESNQ